jgi:hypothetical protein
MVMIANDVFTRTFSERNPEDGTSRIFILMGSSTPSPLSFREQAEIAKRLIVLYSLLWPYLVGEIEGDIVDRHRRLHTQQLKIALRHRDPKDGARKGPRVGYTPVNCAEVHLEDRVRLGNELPHAEIGASFRLVTPVGGGGGI